MNGSEPRAAVVEMIDLAPLELTTENVSVYPEIRVALQCSTRRVPLPLTEPVIAGCGSAPAFEVAVTGTDPVWSVTW